MVQLGFPTTVALLRQALDKQVPQDIMKQLKKNTIFEIKYLNFYALFFKPLCGTFCIFHSPFYASLFHLCCSIIDKRDAICMVVPLFPPKLWWPIGSNIRNLGQLINLGQTGLPYFHPVRYLCKSVEFHHMWKGCLSFFIFYCLFLINCYQFISAHLFHILSLIGIAITINNTISTLFIKLWAT